MRLTAFLAVQRDIVIRRTSCNVQGTPITGRPPRIQAEHRGPHGLRHACAAHLAEAGLSLKEIGDHLGHRGTYATRTYAKVDLVGLREVAAFSLGGLS
jgi:integrase